MLQKSQTAEYKWNHYRQGKRVVVHDFWAFVPPNLNYIVDHDETANDEALPDFDAVDARVDVNCVSRKDRKRAHVNFVNYSQIYDISNIRSQWNWNNYGSQTFVRDQQWQGSNSWHDHFIPPFQVYEIVSKS